MPSYKDILQMIREGKSAPEIYRRLKMRPSHWGRMLAGKRFQAALRSREDLAGVLAVHKIASGVGGAAGRLTELMDSDSAETVRKVCLALLSEGLQGVSVGGEADGADDPGGGQPEAQPWTLLRPVDRGDAPVSGAADNENRQQNGA